VIIVIILNASLISGRQVFVIDYHILSVCKKEYSSVISETCLIWLSKIFFIIVVVGGSIALSTPC